MLPIALREHDQSEIYSFKPRNSPPKLIDHILISEASAHMISGATILHDLTNELDHSIIATSMEIWVPPVVRPLINKYNTSQWRKADKDKYVSTVSEAIEQQPPPTLPPTTDPTTLLEWQTKTLELVHAVLLRGAKRYKSRQEKNGSTGTCSYPRRNYNRPGTYSEEYKEERYHPH